MKRWLGLKAETKTELMEGWSLKGGHDEMLLERLVVKGGCDYRSSYDWRGGYDWSWIKGC